MARTKLQNAREVESLVEFCANSALDKYPSAGERKLQRELASHLRANGMYAQLMSDTPGPVASVGYDMMVVAQLANGRIHVGLIEAKKSDNDADEKKVLKMLRESQQTRRLAVQAIESSSFRYYAVVFSVFGARLFDLTEVKCD